MGEKRMYTCMCNWVTMLYCRKKIIKGKKKSLCQSSPPPPKKKKRKEGRKIHPEFLTELQQKYIQILMPYLN